MYLASVEVDGLRAAADQMLRIDFPGRFAVLLGANGAGKSTVTDAISLAHSDVFPWPARPTSDSLIKGRAARISSTYSYEASEAITLLADRKARGVAAPEWDVELRSSLGQVRPNLSSGAASGTQEARRALPVLYLAATRNPHRDLAGRQARLVVEILRAEARRQGIPSSLDRDRITTAIIDTATQGHLATTSRPPKGYRAATRWADQHSTATSRAWSIEGAGSYGAGLATTLTDAGELVVEFDHPTTRRQRTALSLMRWTPSGLHAKSSPDAPGAHPVPGVTRRTPRAHRGSRGRWPVCCSMASA